MEVLLDTNILIDILARREPYYENAARIAALVETRKIEGVVAAASMPTIFYLVQRKADARAAYHALRWIRGSCVLATCDEKVIYEALDAGWKDFEDAVQYFSARLAGASCLLTRNKDHFRGSDLPVVSPDEFLAGLEGEL